MLRRSLCVLVVFAFSLVVPAAALATQTIWAVGDGAAVGSNDDRVGAMIGAQNFDLFLYLGDVYEDGTASEFASYYDPVYGSYKAKTRPTMGNHEWSSHLTGYDPYWGPAYASPHYYSFDTGDWHVISLNSEQPSDSAQLAWLNDDLAQHPGTCNIAYWHKPRYAWAFRDAAETDAFWNAVVGRAAIVLGGHVHNYQRRSINGTVEFVVGTGGKSHHALDLPLPDYLTPPIDAATNDTDYGALRLTLNRGSAAYDFVALSGATLDSGSIPCDPAPSATTDSASAIDTSSATLSGTVNPHGVPTSYHFEYGKTTAYGSNTADVNVGAGTTDQQVTATLGGLTDGTTYFYRLVSTASPNTAYGSVRSFQTTGLETVTTFGPTLTNGPRPRFGFASPIAGVSFECSIDHRSASFSPCSGPGTTHQPAANLPDGSYTFRVRAEDQAGNTDQSPATRAFIVDTSAPNSSITSGPPKKGGRRRVAFRFSSGDSQATFECALDNRPYATCVRPARYKVGFGKHKFSVRATDAAGNTDPTPARAIFRRLHEPVAKRDPVATNRR